MSHLQLLPWAMVDEEHYDTYKEMGEMFRITHFVLTNWGELYSIGSREEACHVLWVVKQMVTAYWNVEESPEEVDKFWRDIIGHMFQDRDDVTEERLDLLRHMEMLCDKSYDTGYYGQEGWEPYEKSDFITSIRNPTMGE